MERITASRRSPAIIVGVLALVAVVTGTAVAGPGMTTSAINKKKVKKITGRAHCRQIAHACSRRPGVNDTFSPSACHA